MAEDKNKSNDDFEIGDVENYNSGSQQFSHQTLIMKCLNRCVECGTVEMVEGRIENKTDKSGNTSTKYFPDTRRQFIESVKTAKNFLKCDFDEDANSKINLLIYKVNKNKEKWLNEEWDWWIHFDWNLQQKLTMEGKGVIKGMHNQKHFFKDSSISEEVEIWRDILEELNDLTKRLDFYEETTLSG